nr:hypothetical protein [Tanacetum cinerariifolium]
MSLAKKVRGTIEVSELFREKFVKMMGKEASCYKTSCRTRSRLIFGAKRCLATSSYRHVNRESKELELFTDEIIEEGIVDQISREELHEIGRLLRLPLQMEERPSYTKIVEVRMKTSLRDE